MPLLKLNKINLFVSLMLAMIFSGALLVLMPAFSDNILFIALLPVVAIFFLMMVVQPQSALVLLLFVRALLDPVLDKTKIAIGGQNIGLGGGLNLLVVLLTVILAFPHIGQLRAYRQFKYWILFLFLMALSIVYSPQPTLSVRFLFNFVTYMCMALLPFLIVADQRQKRFWLLMLLASTVIPVIWGNIDFALGGLHAGRVRSSFSHPNQFAFYLLFVITLGFLVIKSPECGMDRFKRNGIRFYLLNVWALLVMTQTRNAWLASWLFFVVYGIIKEKRYIVIMLLLPALMLLLPTFQERIQDLFTGNRIGSDEQLNSFAWRLQLWGNALPYIYNKPYFGHGLLSFMPLSLEFSPKAEKMGDAAHNAYIKIVFEMGFIGLLAYVTLFVSHLRRFFQRIFSHHQETSTQAAIGFAYILSYMIISGADNMVYYLAFNWYFWFFVGLLLRGFLLREQEAAGA